MGDHVPDPRPYGGVLTVPIKKSRLTLAIGSATLLLALSVGPALAGEVTGNGKLLHLEGGGLHGNSACAYSGQEDLQFFVDDEQTARVETVVKGSPAHAQSWGQIPKLVRDEIRPFAHPGIACNPTSGFAE